jgi:P-type E1-E2 ATPase
MIVVEIPGRPKLSVEHLVLDVNGTIAQDGQLVSGVLDRVQSLRKLLEIHLLTADTHGRQSEIDRALGVTGLRLPPGEDEAKQKARYVNHLGPDQVIAIGNGANDALMLEAAAIGIVVLGNEGTSADALRAADIVAPSALVALDLVLNPKRLAATLRR